MQGRIPSHCKQTDTSDDQHNRQQRPKRETAESPTSHSRSDDATEDGSGGPNTVSNMASRCPNTRMSALCRRRHS